MIRICIFILLLGSTSIWAESWDTEARALVDRQVAAWNAMDAEAWSADYTEDSDFINIMGTRFQDRAANKERHALLFGSLFRGSTLNAEIVRLRRLGEDGALVDVILILRGHQRPPPFLQNTSEGELRTRMKYVLQRIDGRWHIIAAQNTAISPNPTATATPFH